MKLLKTNQSASYIKNRIRRFRHELFKEGLSEDELDEMLAAVEDYLDVISSDENPYLETAAYKIAEARLWIEKGWF